MLAVLAAVLAVQTRGRAQNLAFSLFERYLESLREQAGIPGLSAVVTLNGSEVWSSGFGRSNLDAAQPATPDTPYVIGGLSQVFGSTLLLKECVDEHTAETSDRVIRWAPNYQEPETTLQQLLSHTAPGGGFRFDLGRVAALTPVPVECSDTPYARLLRDSVFQPNGMIDSVPGHALASPTPDDRDRFDRETLARYAGVVARLALPYRVDSRGRTTRVDVAAMPADASTGIVTTARDLARFEGALNSDSLLTTRSRLEAWTNVTSNGRPLPTGLGWFVQNYNNQPIVWQFGLVEPGYSALMMRAPHRGLTLILLANSDGLSAPFALERGDVTTSLFAQLFLRLFLS